MVESALLQITPATALTDVYRTLQPSPLTTPEELKAFYREEINQVRGGDTIQRVELGLKRAYRDRIPFKACVIGHRGVGKSTEISQLLTRVTPQFQPIRFSATSVLDPGNFKPFDVLLVMMIAVAEQTAKPVDQGGAGTLPPEIRLKELWQWFATEKNTVERTQNASASLSAGAGVTAESLWGKVLGLFAALKGEVKFASTRKQAVVDYRLTRLDELMSLANRLLDDCDRILFEATGKRWLLVGEDFDRAGIPSDRIEDLFITYANIFQDLRAHLIFTLPISLYYSAKANRLPFAKNCLIPDTPIFQADHRPNAKGQSAVETALAARMDLSLFEPGQLSRLVVASGGNLRDLFSLVNDAVDGAEIRGAAAVSASDADAAIVKLRSDYERRLGQSPYDADVVSYEQKAARLKQVYDGNKEAQMTDPVLYSLLNARAVQEFNGQRWFGVHPLVVDILAAQKHLPTGAAGGTV
jgi:hypothetical protein